MLSFSKSPLVEFSNLHLRRLFEKVKDAAAMDSNKEYSDKWIAAPADTQSDGTGVGAM